MGRSKSYVIKNPSKQKKPGVDAQGRPIMKTVYIDTENGAHEVSGPRGALVHNKAPKHVNKQQNAFQENFSDNKKKLNLIDYNRQSYESSYNDYYEDQLGTPKAIRVKVKGYKFINDFGTVVGEVEVNYKNDLIIITKFRINPEYHGRGYSNDLLDIAKSSLSANAVEVDNFDIKRNEFFKERGFKLLKMGKQTSILILDNDATIAKPENVTNLATDYINAGGFDYEGYRNYL